MPTPRRAPWTIGIVGSRRRNLPSDFVKLWFKFHEYYQPGDGIVSGGCKTGGDRWAEEIAREYEIVPTVHYPDFIAYRIPVCYFERNTWIVRDCNILLALIAPDRTGGTEDTIAKALRSGKRVVLV